MPRKGYHHKENPMLYEQTISTALELLEAQASTTNLSKSFRALADVAGLKYRIALCESVGNHEEAGYWRLPRHLPAKMSQLQTLTSHAFFGAALDVMDSLTQRSRLKVLSDLTQRFGRLADVADLQHRIAEHQRKGETHWVAYNQNHLRKALHDLGVEAPPLLVRPNGSDETFEVTPEQLEALTNPPPTDES